jgi:hypothetical protein
MTPGELLFIPTQPYYAKRTLDSTKSTD